MALQALNYTVEVRSPLVVAGWREAYVIQSRLYVPGSVVRGSLARQLLSACRDPQAHDHGHPDWPMEERLACPFYRLFYADASPMIFRNAYAGPDRPVRPVPLTARTCKRHPGFHTGNPEQHGVFDTLVYQVVFRQAVDGLEPIPLIYEPECSRCREMEHADYQADKVSAPFYVPRNGGATSPRLLQRRFSRTAVGRERSAVAEAMLYTVEAIDERMDLDEVNGAGEKQWARTLLQGQVLSDENLVGEVRDWLGKVKWLGSGRSRGLGRVTLAVADPEPLQGPPSSEEVQRFVAALTADPPFGGVAPSVVDDGSARLVDRLLAFNRLWHTESYNYFRAGALPADRNWYFTLDLLSDAVLRESAAPTLKLSPALLGLEGQPELVQSFVQGKLVGGWSEAAGLPKETALAVAMGGVYLYRVNAGDEDSVRRILTTLHTLEQQGVGDMRQVGFGQVEACSPFHLEVNPL